MTAEQERAAVVAWLRDEARRLHKMAAEAFDKDDDVFARKCMDTSVICAVVADKFERGDHIRKDEGHE